MLCNSFPFALFALNSFKIAVLGTVGQLISTTWRPMPFPRMNFPGRKLIFYCLLATLDDPRPCDDDPNLYSL